MKQLKGFKLVSPNLESLYLFAERKLKYRQRHPVVPLPYHGPLAVFRTIQSARSFRSEHDRLFACTYIPSVEEYLYTPLCSASRHLCPFGTDLACQVTLREEIK